MSLLCNHGCISGFCIHCDHEKKMSALRAEDLERKLAVAKEGLEKIVERDWSCQCSKFTAKDALRILNDK